jgi:hypothetical protein
MFALLTRPERCPRIPTVMSFFARMPTLARPLLLVLGGFALAMAALATFPGEGLAGSSADISESASISAAVEALGEAGILRGRDSSSLIPHDYVSRAQLAVFLARALGLGDAPTPSRFTDVDDSVWYAGAVGAMYRAGLITGTTSTTFAPDEYVSRQQAVAWIVESLDFAIASELLFARIFEYVGLPSVADKESVTDLRLSSIGAEEAWLGVFQDRSLIDPAYARSAANGYRLGIVDPSADGWFYPQLPLSWGDMVVMLDRAFAQPVFAQRECPLAVTPQASYPPLAFGSEGPLVWFIEHRLRSLNYRPGPIDGVYDERTRDAVLAFQKVERLARDGIAGRDVWERIFIAETPLPKLVEVGTRVEVDLARQVLFMITDNEVWKIVHVSTGQGGCTPTGQAKIFLKQPGWNSGHLGSMYYVSYFKPHYAIHGMPSVPAYPASHGCVRVPMWMAVELFYDLPMETRVDLYYK